MTPVFRIAAVLAGLVAGLATAAAQPTQPAPPPTGGAPAPAVMRPPPNEPPPPAPVEDPAMATYREGYAALVAGDFTTARAKLGVVAETAVDPSCAAPRASWRGWPTSWARGRRGWCSARRRSTTTAPRTPPTVAPASSPPPRWRRCTPASC
jgi:hypothetical protein